MNRKERKRLKKERKEKSKPEHKRKPDPQTQLNQRLLLSLAELGVIVQHTVSEAHYGNGVVLCDPGGCRTNTWEFLGHVFNGYELSTMTAAMLGQLEDLAKQHKAAHPTHPVRMIVFEYGMANSGETLVTGL